LVCYAHSFVSATCARCPKSEPAARAAPSGVSARRLRSGHTAFLDAISTQTQVCRFSRSNWSRLLFCSPVAGADFSCFSILQGTVAELVIRICLCGRFRPWLGFTTGTVTGKPGYSRSGQTLEQQQVAVRLVRPRQALLQPRDQRLTAVRAAPSDCE